MSATDRMPAPYAGSLAERLTGQVMWLRRTVRLGVKTLWLHRLRSLLTMLGIVFGVCSVIAMLAIGEGASYEAQEQIRSLGSNNVILRSVKPPEAPATSMAQSRTNKYGLTYSDISRIRATIPGITVVVPARIIRKDVWHRTRNVDCDIRGTVPWYPEMRNHQVAQGRFFSEIELDRRSNVTVLGASMARELFPFDHPVGRSVKVGSTYYRVVGVMEPESRPGGGGGAFGMGGGGQDSNDNGGGRRGAAFTMYVPITSTQERFGETIVRRGTGTYEAETVELHEVTVNVHNTDDVVESALIMRDILAASHRQQDYEVVVPLELLRQAERTKRIFNIVLGAIAGISLLVGGIGIMNIMLASVTERTREIGIRRALGAKKRDIVLQFLIETVLLAGTGGILGVVIGIAIPFFITVFADMITIVTFWSPLVAFSISAMVGVIFGIYPAMRAANMDPVEALRHE